MFLRKRKVIVSIVAVLLLAVTLTGCGGSNSGTDNAGKKTQLVIATWGGASETGLREMVKPFEAEHNVEIVFDIGNNSDRLNKLRANKGNPQADIALMTDCFSVMGNEEGIFDTISPENVPNLNNLYDFAKDKNGFGPAYSVVRYGIVYDAEEIKETPDSWADFWDPAYNSKLALPDITSTAGPMFLVTASELNGGDDHNIEPGFQKMQDLKSNIVNFYLSPTDVITMFERKEITMVPFMDIFVPIMQQSDLPIKWADAKEGSFAGFNTINITKGTKNKELAEKFVNFILSEEVQKQIAEVLFEAPTNQKTVVDEAVAQHMAYGKEKVESLILFDWSHINAVKNDWIERWNKEISSK
jgi:putative spermidine/putrescine transport system substrate-binding protein